MTLEKRIDQHRKAAALLYDIEAFIAGLENFLWFLHHDEDESSEEFSWSRHRAHIGPKF